jgi:hypothetical protein
VLLTRELLRTPRRLSPSPLPPRKRANRTPPQGRTDTDTTGEAPPWNDKPA